MTPPIDSFDYIYGNGRDLFDMPDPEDGDDDDLGITIDPYERNARACALSPQASAGISSTDWQRKQGNLA